MLHVAGEAKCSGEDVDVVVDFVRKAVLGGERQRVLGSNSRAGDWLPEWSARVTARSKLRSSLVRARSWASRTKRCRFFHTPG